MEQGKVKFSKEFITPTGLKEWVTLEWPIDVPFDEEKAMQTYAKVKEFVCNTQPVNASLYDNPYPLIGANELPVINKESEGMEPGLTVELLMSCTSITSLQTFYLLVDRSDSLSLKEAYDTRKAQLVEKETKEILDATNARINK